MPPCSAPTRSKRMPAHRAVLESENSSKADNARKNTAFPPVCKKCAKVCRAPENGKSHEESYDSSWDFGALEGTRIPGPLIKSQMLYRLSYERIFSDLQILPNYITTPAPKKQEESAKKCLWRLVILNAKEQIPRRMTGTRSIAFIFLP